MIQLPSFFFLDSSISQSTDIRSILIYNIAYDFHLPLLPYQIQHTKLALKVVLHVNKDIFLTVNLFVHN